MDVGIGDKGDRATQGINGPFLGCRDLYRHCPRRYVGWAESGGIAGSGGVVALSRDRFRGDFACRGLAAVQALGPKVEGAIVGKAFYDGKLDYRAALAALGMKKERCENFLLSIFVSRLTPHLSRFAC